MTAERWREEKRQQESSFVKVNPKAEYTEKDNKGLSLNGLLKGSKIVIII